MTSADFSYRTVGPLDPSAASALRDGVVMLGFDDDAHLVLRETGRIGPLLAADAEGTPDPLGAFVVASELVKAAGTRIYSLDEGSLDAAQQNLEFYEEWQRLADTTIRQSASGKKFTFGWQTGTDAALRNETLLIGWRIDYSPPAKRSAVQPDVRSRAFAAFTDLRRWLNMSVEEAAELVGVSRTTPVTSWQGKGHEPQASKARRLYQLHASVGSVIDQLGEQGTILWLNAGPTPPADLMRESDLSAFADAVERLTIRNRKRFGPAAGSDVAPREDVAPVAPGGQRRRATVRKRR